VILSSQFATKQKTGKQSMIETKEDPFAGGSQELTDHLVATVPESYLPQDHEPGTPIVGLPINQDFNRGVVQGPNKAPQEVVDQYAQIGVPETDVHKRYDTEEKIRNINVDTYPVGAVGEMAVVKAGLEQELGEQTGQPQHNA
jgi:hypothetical protein